MRKRRWSSFDSFEVDSEALTDEVMVVEGIEGRVLVSEPGGIRGQPQTEGEGK